MKRLWGIAIQPRSESAVRFGVLVLMLVVISGLSIYQVSNKPIQKHFVTMRDFQAGSYNSSPHGNAELMRLAAKYESVKKNSWHYEEWFLREFFEDKRGGFFLDVGAYHWQGASNTLFLESSYEWSGIAVDAQESFRKGYEDNRPQTAFFTYFVSDKSDAVATLNITENKALSTANEETDSDIVGVTEVPTITIDDLLRWKNVTRVDFVNIDIEGYELYALRGFDINKYRPELVCVETLGKNAEIVEEYFQAHGYQAIEPWSSSDTHNVYYSRGGCRDWKASKGSLEKTARPTPLQVSL